MLCMSLTTFAQKDVTKFLGIPVDGTKSEMIRKLKEKGFTSSPYDSEVLQGEFNGTSVNIFIITTNNKVSRIAVIDQYPTDETTAIKLRFNKLCDQFSNNARYMSPNKDQHISKEEDIAYGMIVHDKQYEALFYQEPTIDSITIAKELETRILSQLTEEELSNQTDKTKEKIQDISISYAMEILSKKPVWFTISRKYGKYEIQMFYDNEYNRANGEDL